MNPDARDTVIEGAYADLARPVAPAVDPVGAVRRRMRRRSRRRRSVGGVLAAAVVAVVAVGTTQLVTGPSTGAGGSAAGAAPPTGALPDGETASCAFAYDRTTLRQRDWAADATVTSIGRGLSTVTVRLEVHTWYRGGSGDTLRVRLPEPGAWLEDGPPAYDVGTRLLLSGARSDGTLIPWSCGFTRYYDEGTAAVWAQVFGR